MNHAQVLALLRSEHPAELCARADAVRAREVGDEVHLRGLLEVSSHCRRACTYCGLASHRRGLPRYRMSAEEVLQGAEVAHELGYGSVVIQAGEDPGLSSEWVAQVVQRIKERTPLAITLSLGERMEDLARWREAGADRYLLRIETTDPQLHKRIHPPRPGHDPDHRFRVLERLHELGYAVGSGVMVGIPGQSWESLAGDLLWFRDQGLAMVGLGPWVPDPATPLSQAPTLPDDQQVPHDAATTLRVLALTRLLCPQAHIPSTTALATLGGRQDGLRCGANVVMPNLTPPQYRFLYQIYPHKAGSDLGILEMDRLVRDQLRALGRPPGRGRGDPMLPSA